MCVVLCATLKSIRMGCTSRKVGENDVVPEKTKKKKDKKGERTDPTCDV